MRKRDRHLSTKDRHKHRQYIPATRPFRAWDCEGKTFKDGSHRIVLLANSDGEYIESEKGLHTEECLAFITRRRIPAINVWFAFGYDVSQILRDIPLGEVGDGEWKNEQTLAALIERGRIRHNGHSIRYVPHKFFHIKKDGISFRSFDVFGFFQKSFLDSCEDWNIDASAIKKGKTQRSQFAKWSLKAIREYNDKEMALLVKLMNKLRTALQEADLLPSSWHGPGAIAQVWFKREDIKQYFPEAMPIAMREPMRHAYFGGRIDISTIGEVDVERYDIASAYPHALSRCIDLRQVTWHYSEDARKDDEYALYHVVWNTSSKQPYQKLWHPFPWRTNDGTVLFPDCTVDGKQLEGWYWGVEVLAAERLFPKKIQRIAAFYPKGNRVFPLQKAIERDYLQRLRIGKETGYGRAIKLALNSLYGKLCQHQVTQLIHESKPQWQNFAWAGWITAATRARILEVVRSVGSANVYEVMTDGVLSLTKLKGSYEGKEPPIGSWESKGKVTALIVAAGLYAFFDSTGHCRTTKQRGMPSGINFGYVLRTWGCTTTANTPGPNRTKSITQQYVGIGKALHSDEGRNNFGRFIRFERKLRPVVLLGTTKRVGRTQAFADDEEVWKAKWRTMMLLPTRPKLRETQQSVVSRPYKWLPEYKWEDVIEE